MFHVKGPIRSTHFIVYFVIHNEAELYSPQLINRREAFSSFRFSPEIGRSDISAKKSSRFK